MTQRRALLKHEEDRCFKKLVTRRNQLWQFYNKRGETGKLKTVNDIIASYAYKDTLASLQDKYGAVPPGWKADLKYYTTGRMYALGNCIGVSKLHEQSGK